jgi:hypothetical protein
MKVYTFFTDSHKVFLNNFIETFPFEEGLDLEIKYFPQECRSGKYREDGWKKTMWKKVEYIIESLNETEDNEMFVHADIDIQFFGNIKNDLIQLIDSSNKDILFQDDGGVVCMGFFICRKNEKTLSFFKKVLEFLNSFEDDQVATNYFLKENTVSYGILPQRYYTVGIKHGLWFGDETKFEIPNDILMHHANYTKGVDNKLKLLKHIKEIFNYELTK